MKSELDEIYRLSGELVMDWSAVEVLWYLAFTTLMKDTKRETIDAIYNIFETGSGQRALVMAVADTVYPPNRNNRPHPVRVKIGKLYARTNDLSGIRNAVAHGRISIAVNAVRIAPGINIKKPNRLSGNKQVSNELRNAIQEVGKLYHDLEEFLNSLIPLEQRYWQPELIEALKKAGFQVPTWVLSHPSPPVEVK